MVALVGAGLAWSAAGTALVLRGAGGGVAPVLAAAPASATVVGGGEALAADGPPVASAGSPPGTADAHATLRGSRGVPSPRADDRAAAPAPAVAEPVPRPPDAWEAEMERLGAAEDADRKRIEALVASAPDAGSDVRAGWRALVEARRERGRGGDALEAYDRARRLLSRGLLQPEADDPAWRETLRAAVEEGNAAVYGGRRALAGATEEVEVAEGDYPLRLVRGRALGFVALLRWSGGGDLNPRHLRAGSRILRPTEPVWLLVHRARGSVDVLLGDAWVRAFSAAVAGGRSSPDPGLYALWAALGPDFGSPPTDRGLGEAFADHAWMRADGVAGASDGGSVSLFGVDDPAARAAAAARPWALLGKRDSVELLGWVHSRHAPRVHVLVR